MILFDGPAMKTSSFRYIRLLLKLCFNAFFAYVKLFESKRKQTCRCESYNSCDFVRARGNSWLQFCWDLESSLTLNISRPPWTRSIVTSAGFLCYYLASTVGGTKKVILLKLTTWFLWKSSEMLSISYKIDSVHIVEVVIKPIENLRVFLKI